MITLYRPVLIESAEQAEALPIGTLARHDDHMPVEKWRDEDGSAHWGYIEESVEVDLLRGWTALVPIEAEEETREHPRRHEKAPRAGEAYLRPATMTRLVTPWEEA